jgi:hypothetical protein
MKASHVYIHRVHPGKGREGVCSQNCVLATFRFENNNIVIVETSQYTWFGTEYTHWAK